MASIIEASVEREVSSACSMPLDNWFLAARSNQVGARRPLARTLLGRPVVLFRDTQGRVVAMEDRCPHKNVALSVGRVHGDTIQCRYHGWTFDATGVCRSVPCHAPMERLPRCLVRTYPAIERDDWIWVWPGDPCRCVADPPRYPKTPGYGWFELHNVMEAPADLVLENGLDCSHTGFAHEGLFRSAPKAFVRAVIRETATGVVVETLGERREKTREVSSLLGGGVGGGRRQEITHTDELILPHTVRVDYRVGARVHIVTILVCTPETDERTRVYTRMGVRYGRLTWLATPFLYWLTRVIVGQDKAILHSQAETIRRFGGRAFRTTTADQPATWIQRAFRSFLRGSYPPETLRSREVVYKL